MSIYGSATFPESLWSLVEVFFEKNPVMVEQKFNWFVDDAGWLDAYVKTIRVSDVFRGYRKCALRTNDFMNSNRYLPTTNLNKNGSWCPAGIYFFEVNDENKRIGSEICSKLTHKDTWTTSLTSFWCIDC